MTAKKGSDKRKNPDARDLAELKRATKALDATQHNPIEWTPVVKFVAPIVARLAARLAARYVAGKLKKKLPKGVPQDTADYVADKILESVSKVK